MANESKTLIAVLASHDSAAKNIELFDTFNEIYENEKYRRAIRKFHFLFTGGTFRRVVLEEVDKSMDMPDEEVRGFKDKKPKLNPNLKKYLLENSTVFPSRRKAGVTILTNIIVQRQCSIVWPFLSPLTVHWLNPENLALLRLCDFWNVKRLMNKASVIGWFRDEAENDIRRNPQPIPFKMAISTEKEKKRPEAKVLNGESFYVLEPPPRESRTDFFWTKQFDKQAIALIAHDEMKGRMIDFAIEYENELFRFKHILATGTTGQEVTNACRRLKAKDKIIRCLSGPKGGDIEIATEILFGNCDIVIFFIDPLRPHPHIDDIRVVFSACMSEVENNDVRMLTNEVQAREWIEQAVRRRN